MREIKISLETATRWYNGTDAELKELAIQTYPELVKKELPKSYYELGKIKGYFAYANCEIYDTVSIVDDESRNIFATREQAEASIAMAQLSQLMAVYNDGWVADYDNMNYCILNLNGFKVYQLYSSSFLTFKDKETAELFLHNFKDLILTAKTLL